ncbi:MAG: hypothetical protein ACHQ7M_04125, partial [Chloroflexota bacterium]
PSPLPLRRARGSLGLALTLLLAACGGTAAPATSPPPASAAPSGWDQSVAAAKKKGKVVIAGPNYALWTKSLKTFQQAYPDIQVELTEFNSRDFWAKLAIERRAGSER